MLARLFADLSLDKIDVVSYHLAMANKDYREARWGSCVVNCQRLLATVVRQVSVRISQSVSPKGRKKKKPAGPNSARQYLNKSRLLSSAEKQLLSATGNLLARLAGGSHSADTLQAKLARSVSFSMVEFLLCRLQCSAGKGR